MIRLDVTVVAEDADEAANVLRGVVVPRVSDGYTLGFERGSDGERYRFEVTEEA